MVVRQLAGNEQLRASTTRLRALPDAAHELGGISIWTLRGHVKLGTIQTVRVGRRIFISSEEIARIKSVGLPSLRRAA